MVPGQTWGKPPSDTPLSVWACCDPRPLAGETEYQYKARLTAERRPWEIIPLFRVLCEKYGLNPPYLPDPSHDSPGFMFSLVTACSPERVEIYDDDELSHECISVGALSPESTAEVVIKIDLNLPLSVQLQRLEKSLKLSQEQKKKAVAISPVKHRNRVSAYQNYLRVLDGRARGVSFDTLASVILSGVSNTHDTDWLGRRNVCNYWKAAERLCEYDYRYIVMT